MAINIPLALLFAFSVLFLRGKSANLLSIGAVDFGIIVDSSVIMVENIYRHHQLRRARRAAAQGAHHPRLPRGRASRCSSRRRSWSVAFMPLFTMQGPEGQIFGPMADTYAFALGGALLLALTWRRCCACCSSSNLKPARGQLPGPLPEAQLPAPARTLPEPPLARRWRVFGMLVAGDGGLPALPGPRVHARAGRGQPVDPRHLPRQRLAGRGRRQGTRRRGRSCASTRRSSLVASQIGRPDDGTDPTGFYNVEFFVPLQPQKRLARRHVEQTGWLQLAPEPRGRAPRPNWSRR